MQFALLRPAVYHGFSFIVLYTVFTVGLLPCTITAVFAQGGYLGLEVVKNHVVYTRRYTPAEKAGLLPGDEILSIDAKSVQGLGRDAIERLLQGAAGDQVTISARRGKTQFVVVMPVRDQMPESREASANTARGCYEMGVKQRELGMPNESRESMQRAISLDRSGEIGRRAANYIRTQLPLYPVAQDAINLNNTAWNLSRSSRDQEALTVFLECVRRYPNFEWPRNNLAGIYKGNKQFAKANEMIDYVLKFHPEYVSSWKTRGNIREDEGDIAGAKSCFRKAVELDPDDKQARQGLARLDSMYK